LFLSLTIFQFISFVFFDVLVSRVEFWRGIALQPFLPSFFVILVVVVFNFGEGLPFSPSFLPSLLFIKIINFFFFNYCLIFDFYCFYYLNLIFFFKFFFFCFYVLILIFGFH